MERGVSVGEKSLFESLVMKIQQLSMEGKSILRFMIGTRFSLIVLCHLNMSWYEVMDEPKTSGENTHENLMRG